MRDTLVGIGPTPPFHPYKSSLTGQSARALAAAYEASTHKQWTQPIGFAHALFEIAANALARASNLDDKDSIAAAINATSLNTVVGHVQWKGGPVPNVAKTKLAGAQWRKGKKYKYELVVVENQAVPSLELQGKLLPISYT